MASETWLPLEYASRPDLIALIPEHQQPLPVDFEFRDVCTTYPFQGIPVGPQVQGALAVFSERAGELRLRGYSRGPWATVKKDYRNFLARLAVSNIVADGQSVTFEDEGGTNRTLEVWNSGASYFGAVNKRGKFAYGSSATAASEDDQDVITLIADISADANLGLTYDTANKRTTHTGSLTHTAGANTIREFAGFSNMQYVAPATAYFMYDRTVIADRAVANGDVVAMSNRLQF